jgi:hypothetical protein
MLVCDDGQQVPGYIKREAGHITTLYRVKGVSEWRNTPNGALISGRFYIHGLR